MNVLHLLLVLAVITHFVFLVRIPSFLQTQKEFITEYFENCNVKDLPVRFENFSSIRNGSSLLINVEEIVDRDLKNPVSVHYYTKDGKASLDSLAAFLVQGGGSESLLKIRFMIFETSQMIACLNSGIRIKDVPIRHRP